MIYLTHSKPKDIRIHYKSHSDHPLYSCHGFVAFPPKGKALLLYFAYYFDESKRCDRNLQDFIIHAISKDLGVVVLCNRLPKNLVNEEHVIYIETSNRWFTHLLIKNPQVFSAVSYNEHIDAKRYAEYFANYTGFSFPIIRSRMQINSITYKIIKARQKPSVLIQTEDGLGDILMSLPSAKTYYDKGIKVSYYVNAGMNPVFENLKFVSKVYNNQENIPIGEITHYFILSHKLSEYSKDWNQQNRIYSSAYLCGLSNEELSIQRPIINLTSKEKEEAKQILSPYKNTVIIGWQSVGGNRTYPIRKVNELNKLLTSQGYTPIIIGLRKGEFTNCVDMSFKFNLRQLFAIINEAFYIITTDTGILHIAAAFNKKTIALFGPIPAKWRTNTYPNCVTIQSPCSCSPCWDRQRVEQQYRLCKNKNNDFCMDQIKPQTIIKKLRRL